jgi:opacity protein-like surface antigen
MHPNTAGNDATARIANAWTVGPRLGVALDRHLLYVTGGYARAQIETRGVVTATGVTFGPSSVSQGGWFAGAGVDWAVHKYTVIGLEYQHLAFNSAFHCFASPCVVPSSPNHDVSATADLVTARVSWLFH